MGLLITRILSALAGLAFVVLAFIFASLFVAAALAAGLIAWAWLAWRGRGRVVVSSVRRDGSRVIEGEFRVIDQR
jgi:prolipoprotein diacylglyceryltransferase